MTRRSADRIHKLSPNEEAEIQRQIAEDTDDEDSTPAKAAQAKPFAEALPDLMASIKRARGRPTQDTHKQPITIRLDQDVVDHYKRQGKGWQTKLNDDLRRLNDLN